VAQTIAERIDACLSTPFQPTEGRKVPHPDRIALKDGGSVYDGTVLYADLVESTALGARFGYEPAAKIIQSFLLGASAMIRFAGGYVTAYDGDRVMAVFGGDAQEKSAVACSLSIAHLVQHEINPRVSSMLNQRGWHRRRRWVRCCCGVDAGDMLAVKVGLRGNTDLLWSGRPANFAAKLCALRGQTFYRTVITERVYHQLPEELKRSPDGPLWSRFRCPAVGMRVFGSNATIPTDGV
jgi:class 3 adenylate cyclase